MGQNNDSFNIAQEALSWGKDILIAIIIALFIRQFVLAHTIIPSGSMIPTIQINDHIIVNKLTYRFTEPKRGDIVVFHEDIDLIKRVIGLPGEEIDLRDGKVYIDGKVLEEDYLNEPMNTNIKGVLEYPFKIPENCYFVMGDNRNVSQDSRYIGPISKDKIFAKAGLRIWPLKSFGFLK
ncbi:MAG: signal peptidase [Epulopiscium sp.]|jgi:signal peptidase I|uniref:Signal peptidase I n=1 Tax=Defluviitalea raffinosedens TaxID=1450156 RepID=A0A7C8HGD2_9FIRM|nr:signal peptidase I [Defluviitalea raffinosedens]MBZ4669297.1 lepB [Defluviitaleaceae bacterium]MDK2788588.1 signal peptidase [Candidatus Epulonipiscium sp.]KAE9637169.1 signal peptidase I [Defluviitalea raffinosedens]MBM7686527.1 signal peptidase I [Defluviitalea raffinosedens]HHW66804.1 signal peptidase I [Candidatus Epulonipiscium sp.]